MFLYIEKTCCTEISCQLGANPAILKSKTLLHTYPLPLLPRLKHACLQARINIVKPHSTKINVFNDQASTLFKVRTHRSKCRNRIVQILTDIGAKNNISRS